jgi:hypothetical protein
MCGCGEPTPIAPKTSARNQTVKGRPTRYAPQHSRYTAVPEFTIDETTGCWVWQRSTNKSGYGVLRRHGQYLAHRAYYIEHVGPIPEGREIDHVCRNHACVNPDPRHMRLATTAQNGQHRSASGNHGGSSRYRGVHRAPGDIWVARATVEGQRFYLGCFRDEDAAGEAARAFRAEHMPFSLIDRAP